MRSPGEVEVIQKTKAKGWNLLGRIIIQCLSIAVAAALLISFINKIMALN